MRILERYFEDTRFALRWLRKRPSFTLVAILSVAVARGANAAVFSFARAILLDKLPAPRADRFVILRQHNDMFHMENCQPGRRHNSNAAVTRLIDFDLASKTAICYSVDRDLGMRKACIRLLH